MHAIDQVQLAFDPASLRTLNLVLGLILFGVALDLSLDDFRRVLRAPKAPLLGLLAQWGLLPLLTLAVIFVFDPTPSVALGMLLVAAVPGGNVSNYFTHLSGGATEVSVSMTAVTTAGAIVTTPINLAFWAQFHPGARALLTEVHVDPVQMLTIVGTLLVVPIVVGVWVAAKLPAVAARLRPVFKSGSLLFFAVFIGVAFQKNFDHFLAHIATVFWPVLVLNGLAFALGYGVAAAGRLTEQERRALSIEVGIQNTGLGLILVFNFFGGLGGMAVICAWWGIWHLIAGLALAGTWRRLAPLPPR
ncbi:MAG: bile acid:sodium symporter family protein [Deltaproteobacteria bacterium]|nr:MAG: bile acid:sodium symporter family protein [Deltaproteobacteria bacterium]